MRHHALLGYLEGLPLFAAYFALGLLLLGAFVFIYIRVTPYKEIALIRSGGPPQFSKSPTSISL